MKNNHLPKFTKEQSDILEVTYEVLYDDIQRTLSLVNITREGLINAHGEFNKKINPFDVDYMLQTIQALLNPIATEICEASTSANYFLLDKEQKNNYQIWETVDQVLKGKKQ